MASALKDEIDRLENSVRHLERSNRELKEELEANGRDVDYQVAIGDNIVLLAKQKARIASLKEELVTLEGGGAAMQDDGVREGVWM